MTEKHKKKPKGMDSILRDLLREGVVGTHEEICKLMQKKGYEISQSKVSRLLHKLGAVKVVGEEGQNIYRLSHEHGLLHEVNITSAQTQVKHWIIDIIHNESIIIVRTTP